MAKCVDLGSDLLLGALCDFIDVFFVGARTLDILDDFLGFGLNILGYSGTKRQKDIRVRQKFGASNLNVSVVLHDFDSGVRRDRL